MTVTMTTDNLKTIFKACKSFVAKTDPRPALQAVQLVFNDKTCTAYASDDIKMMQITVPYADGDEGEMLVPIIKLPKDPFVTLTDEGNEIVFDFGRSKQVMQKHAGEFFSDPARFFTADSPEYTLYFDPKNLKAALDGFDGKEIKLDFYDPLRPCIITQVPDRRALVFPVKPAKKY